jgi:hypothetical protein
MVTVDTCLALILKMNGIKQHPHHSVTSFKLNGKIVMTLNFEMKRCCLKLSSVDQSVFETAQPEVIYAVPNKWGKAGWTLFELSHVKISVLKDAMQCACEYAGAKSIVQK